MKFIKKLHSHPSITESCRKVVSDAFQKKVVEIIRIVAEGGTIGHRGSNLVVFDIGSAGNDGVVHQGVIFDPLI
jgi:di/tripeptidase